MAAIPISSIPALPEAYKVERDRCKKAEVRVDLENPNVAENGPQ